MAFSPAQSSDDAFIRLGGEYFTLNATGNGVGNAIGRYDATYNKYGCGLRFPNVTIPQGATIVSATLALEGEGGGAGANAKARIRAQAADNPGTFTDATDFKSRILTSGSVDAAKITTSVAWDSVGTISAGTTYTSPDISAVIQEIANRSGWASGNALVLFLDDFDGRTVTDGAYRLFRDYDKATAGTHSPQLTVAYTVARTASESVTFSDVSTPIPTSTPSASDTVSASEGAASLNIVATVSASDTASVSEGTSAAAVLPRIRSKLAGDSFEYPYQQTLVSRQYGTGPDSVAGTEWFLDYRPSSAYNLWVNPSGEVYGYSTLGTVTTVAASMGLSSPGTGWADVRIDAGMRRKDAGGYLQLTARLADWSNFYFALFDNGGNGNAGTMEVRKVVAGSHTNLSGGLVTIPGGIPTSDFVATFEVVGSTLRVFIDGVQVGPTMTDTALTNAGRAGIASYNSEATSETVAHDLVFTSFKVTVPTALDPSDSVTVTEGAPGVASLVTASASDTAALSEGTSSVTGAIDSKAATETVAVSDTTIITNIVAPVSSVTGVTQSGAPTTVVAGSGSSDGLNYNAFPGLTADASGNLVLAFHHANNHIGDGQNKLTVERGASLASMSEIAGSPLRTVSGVNLADVSCWTATDGTVGVCWNESSTPGHATINTVVQFKWALSSNGGVTFGAIQTAAVPGWATTVTAGAGGGAYAVAPCPPVEIPAGQPNAGQFLIATYGWDNRAIEDGGGSFVSHEYVKLVRWTSSTGATTVVSTIFPDTAGTAYDETALLYLHDGTLMAVARTITGSGTGCDLWARRSTDNGATWGTAYRLMGTSSSTGYGGRPSLVQTANGGVLLRFRYMNASTSSWPGYRLSTDNGVSFPGPDIDPYDGTTGRTGGVSNPRGMDIYGAFALTGPNTVAYVWCEETSAGACTIYGRTLTVTGSTSGETVAFADSSSVTVGVGVIAKTATDSFNVTDTSGGLTVTVRKTTGDTILVTDSGGGTSTVPTVTRIATPTSLSSSQFSNSTLGSVQFGNSTLEPSADHPVS